LRTRTAIGVATMIALASVTVRVATASAATTIPGTGCPAFPANNVWNTKVSRLPVHARSKQWMASMHGATKNLHPDYGPAGGDDPPYGIPWEIVPPGRSKVPVSFEYASESDPGPYPISTATPIEGGSDRHALMVDPATCTLYELFAAHRVNGGGWAAGSGAIWSLTSNALRPAGWTSADAAGLPILPGLVNYDEVHAGAMNHAIRVTAGCTRRSYLWPARHQAGAASTCPPMGTRFRLRASFTLPASQCAAHCQTVLTTMKRYGLILADNGSDWFLTGTADARWTSTDVDQLKHIPARQFLVVDESCLRVGANIGTAHQPGTPEFTSRCT
jgi:hypothetical protein